MRITVELPDDVTEHADPGREALEALAVEGYRSRKLTLLQAGRMLGLTRIETENFLAGRVDLYDYSAEELDAEAELLRSLRR